MSLKSSIIKPPKIIPYITEFTGLEVIAQVPE